MRSFPKDRAHRLAIKKAFQETVRGQWAGTECGRLFFRLDRPETWPPGLDTENADGSRGDLGCENWERSVGLSRLKRKYRHTETEKDWTVVKKKKIQNTANQAEQREKQTKRK